MDVLDAWTDVLDDELEDADVVELEELLDDEPAGGMLDVEVPDRLVPVVVPGLVPLEPGVGVVVVVVAPEDGAGRSGFPHLQRVTGVPLPATAAVAGVDAAISTAVPDVSTEFREYALPSRSPWLTTLVSVLSTIGVRLCTYAGTCSSRMPSTRAHSR